MEESKFGNEIILSDRNSIPINPLGTQSMESSLTRPVDLMENQRQNVYINSSRKNLMDEPSPKRYDSVLEQSITPIISIEANVF